MIRLADIITQYQDAFFEKYRKKITPQQQWAINCILNCRKSTHSEMILKCADCGSFEIKPHSCGNRSCPQCQNHEVDIWLGRQIQKLLPVNYYMITFTLPAQLRGVCYANQKTMYSLMFRLVEETLKDFSANPKNLDGDIGFSSILHTTTRRLDYHPHIHVLIPGGVVNKSKGLWKTKKIKYLFNPENLSKVFGAKFRQALYTQSFKSPPLPKAWVVDVRNVGAGEPTLKYLAKYLYRGVISEKSIVSNAYGKITFRYKDGQTKMMMTRTLAGADFIMLILKHVLPKGFRRARDYGFLHPNAKMTLLKLQLFFHVKVTIAEHRKRSAFSCKLCGAKMKVVRYGIKNKFGLSSRMSQREGPP